MIIVLWPHHVRRWEFLTGVYQTGQPGDAKLCMGNGNVGAGDAKRFQPRVCATYLAPGGKREQVRVTQMDANFPSFSFLERPTYLKKAREVGGKSERARKYAPLRHPYPFVSLVELAQQGAFPQACAPPSHSLRHPRPGLRHPVVQKSTKQQLSGGIR